MYNAIIIGGGPAGITASIYIRRAGFKVLVISTNDSSAQKTDKIENYYGFAEPISGSQLIKDGIEQAKNLGVDILNKEVVGIKYTQDSEEMYEVVIANQGKDERYKSNFIVLATGTNRNTPDIKGIKEFEGRGISYCAVCDASFYKNKRVAVIGNGEYALSEIDELLPLVKEVTMFTNGKQPIENRSSISIKTDKIKNIIGTNKVEKVEFENGEKKELEGIFIADGVASSTDLAKKIGIQLNNDNSIKVNETMETTIENIYACGDCTGGILQISKATYEGMLAGLDIIKKSRKNKEENNE